VSQHAFAATLLAPERRCPPGLRTWNGSDTCARLAVYRNNVVGSLIDAVADTFPVVQQIVGEAFFRAMAAHFVREHPPRSRVLAHYGGEFPEFIEQFEPARSVAYLADIARLEWARVVAYHAADVAPLAAHAVGAALSDGVAVAKLRFECHPSMSIVDSRFAIVSIWAAHQREDVGKAMAAVGAQAAESALVVRDGLDVLVLRLPAGVPQFVAALQAGAPLADAADQALHASSDFDLQQALALLARHGALTALRVSA
jgi:hypothetical protein